MESYLAIKDNHETLVGKFVDAFVNMLLGEMVWIHIGEHPVSLV